MDASKAILITGANKGIGLATVQAVLAREASAYVFLGSRDPERGHAAREALLAAAPEWAERLAVVTLDVSRDDSVEAAAAEIEARLGAQRLFGIVNNAGVGRRGADMATVLSVNTRGPQRVCERLVSRLDPQQGRIVNVSSASGPNFVNRCSPARQRALTDPEVTWDTVTRIMDECLRLAAGDGDFEEAGFGGGDSYGLSKACLNAYTMSLARRFPSLKVNACTPGYVETDMTRPYAEARGLSPAEMGMKSPAEGTRASCHLLLGPAEGTGWYFGSDALRSPLDRYRAPGDPPYEPSGEPG